MEQVQATPRVVWITGAGKGIGRSLARLYAGSGSTVVASARTPADLESLVRESAADKGKIVAFPLDITAEADVSKAVERIEAEVGPIDTAILNAGTHRPMSARDFAVEPFRALVETNLMGTVNCLAAVLRPMRARRRGRIAVVASLAGYRGLPSAAAYGATKAALINMCEALFPDLAKDGIRLSLVNPGFVSTPLTDKNDFPMPFLISAEAAARCIAGGLETGRFEIAFPWRFAWIMKCLRLLPARLLFLITRRMVKHD